MSMHMCRTYVFVIEAYGKNISFNHIKEDNFEDMLF